MIPMDYDSFFKQKVAKWYWGASTVKWTTLDPCSGLGESDPKLYTNFEFHEKHSYTFRKHMNLQSQAFYVYKKTISNNI